MAIQSSLGPSEVTRLKDLVFDGVKSLEEIDSLREGMNDTIKAISEELNLPAKLLKRVITTSHKGNFAELEEELEDLDKLLQATGKK